MSEEQSQNKEQESVYRKQHVVEASGTGNVIAAALLFFGGFKCGVWLFIVLLVRHKNRK